MKTEIWDCNNIAPKKPKFAPTREEIAEYTRQYLADGGKIKIHVCVDIEDSIEYTLYRSNQMCNRGL